jgi:hypothetical protein
MKKNEMIEKIRIVEVAQNSWEQENLLFMTTLNDEQIKSVLEPLLDEERGCEDGTIFYDNGDMASILSEKYPNDVVVLYAEPDYLTL